MRVAIYQPQCFPRLHYVNRALDSDVFVLLSSAQYTSSMVHHLPDGRRERRKTYQSHVPIKQPEGEHLLTVPVRSDTKGAPIDQVLPDDGQPWRARHRRTLRSAYGRAGQFDARFGDLEVVLDLATESLADFNITTLLWALDVVLDLQIGPERLSVAAVNARLAGQRGTRLRQLVIDGQLEVERPAGRQTGSLWVARICEALGADEYLFGGTATDYMDKQDYADRGIGLVQQQWPAPPYPQLFEDRVGFLANLSIIDLLLNTSPATAAAVLYPDAGSSAVARAPGSTSTVPG